MAADDTAGVTADYLFEAIKAFQVVFNFLYGFWIGRGICDKNMTRVGCC